MVGEVKTFNNCNANEDHSWGIKWENNDDILEYDYKTLKSLIAEKHWIPPSALTDASPAERIVDGREQKRIEQLCGAGFSALWKGMFPNAWARLLAEAGIDSRTINKKSAELRSAMLEGQR